MRFPGGSNGRVCLQCWSPGFDPWVRKIPWRRKWQPAPVFLPGESHGQRSLAGYSPWDSKELGTTEQLHFHFSLLMSPACVWVALLQQQWSFLLTTCHGCCSGTEWWTGLDLLRTWLSFFFILILATRSRTSFLIFKKFLFTWLHWS